MSPKLSVIRTLRRRTTDTRRRNRANSLQSLLCSSSRREEEKTANSFLLIVECHLPPMTRNGTVGKANINTYEWRKGRRQETRTEFIIDVSSSPPGLPPIYRRRPLLLAAECVTHNRVVVAVRTRHIRHRSMRVPCRGQDADR